MNIEQYMTVECECRNWCRDGRPPITKHHRNCGRLNLDMESLELVKSLINGIEAWASDEDGVHPDVFEAYCKALCFTGQLSKLKSAIEKTEWTPCELDGKATHG